MSPKLRVTLSAFLPLLFFAACTSALKKKCESTNWFDYGEGVAKHGQRVSSDQFLLQCETEEAKIDHSLLSQGFQKGLDEYCTPDFAYRLGRQGEFISTDMCSGAMEIAQKPRHADGVREYCQPGNGETAGATGKKYNQICPKELEPAFMPEFNKGRKKFLSGVVIQKQGQAQDIEREISDLDRHKQELRQDIQRMEWERNLTETNAALDPAVRTSQVNDLSTRMRTRQWDVDRADQQIGEKRAQQQKLLQEAREAQAEMGTL